MLSSPISIWDATNILFKSTERDAYNNMIKEGKLEEILDEITKRKATVEAKLTDASGEELE